MLVFAIVYFCAARWSLLLAFPGSNASPIWPPAGIAVAGLSLLGGRYWPAITLGAFAANLSGFLAQGIGGVPVLAVSLGIAAGNTLEALGLLFCMRRWIGGDWFAGMARAVKLSLAALAMAALGAAIGTACLLAGGLVPASLLGTVSLTWWLGDGAGLLLVTPLLLAWLRPAPAPGAALAARALGRLPFALATAGGLAWLLFAWPAGTAQDARPWLFLLTVPLAYSAITCGLRGVTLVNAVITAVAVAAVAQGRGMFSMGELNDALIQLDMLLILFGVVGLVLAADLGEQHGAATWRGWWRQMGWSWLGLLLAMAASMLTWHLATLGAEHQLRDQFEARAELVRATLATRVADYQLVLKGAVGLLEVRGTVARADWRNYVGALDLKRGLPGVQGVGLALRLPPDGLARHQAEVRAEGLPDYTVHPSGPRPEYTSVVYLEPLDAGNRVVLGYDMQTEPTRHAAMTLARDSGQPAMSAVVTLLQSGANGSRSGFLIYLPVYRVGAAVETVTARRLALTGYVYSPFLIDDFMAATMAPLRRDIGVEVFDGAGTAPAQRMFARGVVDTRRQAGLQRTLALTVGQHRWTVRVTAAPAFVAAAGIQKSSVLLLAGMLVGLSLFALVRTMAMTQRRAQDQAQRSQQAFQEAESRLNALVRSAGEAILMLDQSGAVLMANPAAELMFGRSADVIRSVPFQHLFQPSDRRTLYGLKARAVAGEELMGELSHLVAVHASGKRFPVTLSLSHWSSTSGGMYGAIIRDTSEQERAAEFMRGVFDEGGDSMLVFDQDGRVQQSNQAAARAFGYAPEQLRGCEVGRLLPALVAAGNDGRGQLAVRADGSSFPAEIRCNALRLREGELTVATVIDTSARVAAERQIGRLARLQTAILNGANLSVIATDLQGVVLSINAAGQRMLGYSSEDMLGRLTPAVIHDPAEVAARAPELSAELGVDVAPGFEVFVAKARRSGLEEREWTYVRKDGSRFPVLLSVTALRNEVGEIDGFLGIAMDISARRQTEQAMREQEQRLRESEEMLRGLFEMSPLGIALTDAEGKYVEFNDAFRAICGYSDEELRALDYWTLTPPEYADAEQRQLESLQRTGRYGPYEKEYLQKSGARVPIRLNGVTVKLQGRDCIWSIVEDISPQKRSERAMREAQMAAESANLAKSEFLANMSHEIRTPMNAVLGMAQLMADTDLSSRQREFLDMIRGAGQSLLAILNDILDFSKIEAGCMELEPAPFRLSEVLDALAGIMKANAAERALELEITVGPDVPDALVGDALRLRQVLINLAGNAIKFTERGGVSVLVELVERHDDLCSLRLQVRDTGIGMDSAHQARLFMAFSQGDASMTRRFGGTGLGLAICRRLVLLMGGTIDVQSQSGEGSVFSVTVPLTVGAEPVAVAPAAAARTFLVVAPAGANRDYLCRTLASRGWQVEARQDMEQAVRSVKARLAAHERFDGVLLDGRCDDGDAGDGVLLHALLLAQGIPVVVMAGGQAGERWTDAKLLFKPVTATSLMAGLERLLHGDVQVPEAARNGDAADAWRGRFAGKRLLLVEDHPLNQLVARGVLEYTGARIDVAENGQQALDRLRADAGQYDLVLMDVQMPVMDGFEATRVIRQVLGLRLPILAMSAGVMLSEREHCRVAGMDDFIAKPINRDHMLALVGHYLQVTPDAAAPVVLAAMVEQMGDGPDFDVTEIWAYSENDGAARRQFHAMVARTMAQAPADFLAVRQAVEQGGVADAAHRLHTMRGALGTLGTARFAQAASALEEALRGDQQQRWPLLLEQAEQALRVAVDAAQVWLAQHRPEAGDDGQGAVGDVLAGLVRWRGLLVDQDLAACSLYEQLRAPLGRMVTVETGAAIEAAMARLDFAAVLALVDAPALSS
nr:PAS domain S-box protein [Duganella vulcania]